MMPRSPVPVPRKILTKEMRIPPRIVGIKPNSWLTNGPGSRTSDGRSETMSDTCDTCSTRGSPDLNLHTLIDSVERDIELLEQMENGSHHRHNHNPGHTSLVLPASAALLNLPGYKPRQQVNSDRRNSIETAKNTNPGYDALLCTRLYPEVPSTPPPLPKKLRTHRRTNSDSSMNTSVTAPTSPEVAPGTPASPSEAVIASRLTSHLMQQPRPTFCPLCPGYFYSQTELRDHLVQAHSDDLSLIKKNLKHFKKETCPCCEAEFLKSGLGPQHLVHHHPQYVCSIMFGRPPPSPAPSRPHLPHPGLSTPPPERHSFCLLCGQRFLKKHVKLLALHLQQQHPKKFSQVMDTYFVSENKTSLEPKQTCPVPQSPKMDQKRIPSPLSPYHHYEDVDTSIMSNFDQEDSCDNNAYLKPSQDPGLFKENNNKPSHAAVIKRMRFESDGFQPTPNFKSFKRRLPHPLTGSETYHGVEQPEPEPILPITGDTVDKEWEREMYRSVADSDSFYSYTYNNDKALFRCNLCGDKFTQNSNLLVHLKTNHMAVSRALKAQFSCAKCPAKFFKNDFLLKHSLTHR